MAFGKRTLVVIPARLGSERLPRKPLHPLAGRPLIEWVWRRVETMSEVDAVVVATDSEEVVSVCRAMGAEVELTSPDHASGTERIAELVRREAWRDFEVIVNVQGDEPFVSEREVQAAAELVRTGWDVGTVATPIRSRAALHDPAVVKAVRDANGGALYFSRAPGPFSRAGWSDDSLVSDGCYLRHIGIYAYTPATLERWTLLPPSRLEQIERLEQLRALEGGLSIGVAVVQESERGVDTPEDAQRAEARLSTVAAHAPGGDS
jgi:3-deoxy-manno-octulosonate cytidylyltransferase (CMP-KDO synthetase)